MRFLAAVGALLLAAMSPASAQVQVSAQTARNNFLLYERVDLLITVTNASDTDVVLDNNEGHPWLSFLVSHKKDRLPVRPERPAAFRALNLKVGESKTLRVNLTPLFSFREEGDFTAEAVVDLPGAGEIVTDPVPFTVLRGRKIWSETRPVNGSQYVYSLLRFNPKSDETKLYLRVENPTENIVLTNIALGNLAAYIDPDVFFDPAGNIHIMQPVSEGTYLYSRANANGRVEHQGIFRTFQTVPPRLAKLQDGNVIVFGGLEENPANQHETLSGGQREAKATPAGDTAEPMPNVPTSPLSLKPSALPPSPADHIPVARPASASTAATPQAGP